MFVVSWWWAEVRVGVVAVLSKICDKPKFVFYTDLELSCEFDKNITFFV